MTMLWTVLFWAFAVCFVWMLLMGYGGIARLVGALFRLGGYADKIRAHSYGRETEDSSVVPVTVVLPQAERAENPSQYLAHHLQLDYPEYEVIVVCDGSKNATLAKLQTAFQLIKIDQPIKLSVPMAPVRGVYRSGMHEHLIVVDKAPNGCADALNCGVNISRYPFVATVGPNRWLQSEGLWLLCQPFTMQYECAAVGGLPRRDIAGGAFARLQQINLLMNYPAGLAVPGQHRLPLVTGAYGTFRKMALIKQGGFAAGSAELDAAARLFIAEEGKKAVVQMLPQPACEIVPRKGLRGLWRACAVSQKELCGVLWRCRGILLRPRFGRTALWDIPLLALSRVLGPVLEVLGMVLSIVLFCMGVLPTAFFWGFWAVMVLFAGLTALAALLCQRLEGAGQNAGMRHLLRDVACALLYPLGFYQLLAVLNTAALFAKKQ